VKKNGSSPNGPHCRQLTLATASFLIPADRPHLPQRYCLQKEPIDRQRQRLALIDALVNGPRPPSCKPTAANSSGFLTPPDLSGLIRHGNRMTGAAYLPTGTRDMLRGGA
jgi:hypothetical protein